MSKKRRFLRRVGPLERPLTAYCRRLLWSPADLEDALQETLARAYGSFSDPPERELRRWVFRIATWTCFDANRRRRQGAVEIEEAVADPAAVETLEREWTYEQILADPVAACEGLGDELARACRRLNENERAIVLLKSLGELTCAEIAAVLDIPLGTAQGLLTRARQKLRLQLTDRVRTRGSSAPASGAPGSGADRRAR